MGYYNEKEYNEKNFYGKDHCEEESYEKDRCKKDHFDKKQCREAIRLLHQIGRAINEFEEEEEDEKDGCYYCKPICRPKRRPRCHCECNGRNNVSTNSKDEYWGR